jgi:hypothetical protein
MTPTNILLRSAALLNDQAQTVYTNTVQIPYLNMALEELQEIFELNDINYALDVSAIIQVNAGSTTFTLPADLIEIKEMWERARNINPFTRMSRKDFIPHYLEGQQIGQFLIWAMNDGKVELLPANQDNDIKLDYVKSIFTEVNSGNLNQDITPKNTSSYLQFKTAALCSEFIGENKTRSDDLNMLAMNAVERSLGISVKGKQAISTRRRPFRSAYKRRSVW